MNIRRTTLAATIALLSLSTLATVPSVAQAQIVVQVAPPPPRYERVPPPRRGQVWAPGHWEWRGHRHVWVQGHFLRARPGYAYREPRWDQRGDRWEMRRGGWDRDGDGVPNGADRKPNNPRRY